MANLLTPPKIQFFDLNGNPLSGGLLYTYAAGTTTPLSTFTDAGGLTPNANPIILNARGEANIWLGSSLYFLTLADSSGSVIWTVDNVGGLITQTQLNNYVTLATLASSSGSSLTGFIQSGTGAVLRTVQSKLRDLVSAKDFGAVGDGIVDDTTAIQNALNGTKAVYLPAGTYKITSQLVFGANCPRLYGDDAYLSILSKTFNGNAILCDTSGAMIKDIGIIGNGATYTGGGIVPRGYNITIQHCRITDTADSCVLIPGAVGSNNLAATYLLVDSCFLNPTNSTTTYSIRCSSADDANRPTARVFSKISGGSTLVDFSGMNYAVLENSLGTLIKFDANSGKIRITGNRFTNAGANLTILGNDHIIDGNLFGFGGGFGLTIAAAASNVYFGPNNNIVIGSSAYQSIIDSTTQGNGNLNNLTSQLNAFIFTWLGSVTNPTIGNGTSYAYYKQEGRLCWASFGFTVNTTTNIGSGVYSFQLPFKPSVSATGTALLKSSSGTYYTTQLITFGGTALAYAYIGGLTAPFSSTSVALSTNSTFDATIVYMIAPV